MEDLETAPTIAATSPRSVAEFTPLVRALVPDMPQDRIEQLLRYRDMLHAHNQVVNLTAVRDFDGIERRLILESLRLVKFVEHHAGDGRIMDLGSGGGIPGIVLAIALPHLHFTLLDATGKKVAFQRSVIEALELSNARAIQARAEELGHDINWRNTFDLVTARAVTSLSALMELGLPFVSMKGWLLLPKGIEIEEELAIARRAAGKLGGTIVAHDIMPDCGSDVETRLVLVRKDQATPSAYPRRTGLPAKSPLGTEPATKPSGRKRGRN